MAPTDRGGVNGNPVVFVNAGGGGRWGNKRNLKGRKDTSITSSATRRRREKINKTFERAYVRHVRTVPKLIRIR